MLILGSLITAPEALALGLVTRLSKEGQTLEDARALARQLGTRPPIATRLIIEAVDDGLEAPIDKAIDVEVRAFLRTPPAGGVPPRAPRRSSRSPPPSSRGGSDGPRDPRPRGAGHGRRPEPREGRRPGARRRGLPGGHRGPPRRGRRRDGGGDRAGGGAGGRPRPRQPRPG